MKTLYQIGSEHLSIIEDIESADGEITDAIQERINLLAENFEEKAVAYGFVIKKYEDEDAIIEAEIKRLQALRQKAGKVRDYLKDRISNAMHQFGLEEIKSPILKLSFRASKETVIEDESKLPESCFTTKTTRTVSKTEVKKLIEEGQVIEGAYIRENKSLQIK